MQIFADVTGRVVALAGSSQTTALGSALFAAVAAGPAAGGYASLAQAAKRMARLKPKSYKPSAKNQCLYDSLYQHYARLYDFFGRAQPQLMKSLRLMKTV
jgi:L-ribulokinase